MMEDFFEDAAGAWMRLPSGRWYLLGGDEEIYRDDTWLRGSCGATWVAAAASYEATACAG